MYLAIKIFSRLGKAKQTTHDNYRGWVLHYILTHFATGISTGLDMPCGKTAHTYTHSLLIHLVLSPHSCPYHCINTPSHKHTCIYISVQYFLIQGHNHVIWRQPHSLPPTLYIHVHVGVLSVCKQCCHVQCMQYGCTAETTKKWILKLCHTHLGLLHTGMDTSTPTCIHTCTSIITCLATSQPLSQPGYSATIHHAGVHVHPPTEVIIMRGKGAVF